MAATAEQIRKFISDNANNPQLIADAVRAGYFTPRQAQLAGGWSDEQISGFLGNYLAEEGAPDPFYHIDPEAIQGLRGKWDEWVADPDSIYQVGMDGPMRGSGAPTISYWDPKFGELMKTASQTGWSGVGEGEDLSRALIQGSEGLPTYGTDFGGGFARNAGGRWFDQYDDEGYWTGRDLASSGWVDWREGIVKPALMAAAMYFGVNGLNEALSGATAGAEIGGAAAAGAEAGTIGSLAEMEAGLAGLGGATVTPELLATLPELAIAGGAGAVGGTIGGLAEMEAGLAGMPPAQVTPELIGTLPEVNIGTGALSQLDPLTRAGDSQIANQQLNLPPNSGSVPSAVDIVNGGGLQQVGGTLPTNTPNPLTRAGDSQIANEQLNLPPNPGSVPGAVDIVNGGGLQQVGPDPWGWLPEGLKQYGSQLANLDPAAWQKLLTGIGLVDSLTGNSSGSPNPGGPQAGFGEFDKWTPAQQGKVDQFMNRDLSTFTPPPRRAFRGDEGFEGGFARGGSAKRGALSQMMPHHNGIPGGQDDVIEARLAPGEFVFDAETVAMLGDGDNDAGAAKLEEFRRRLRSHKRAASAKDIPPRAKKPEAYLKKV